MRVRARRNSKPPLLMDPVAHGAWAGVSAAALIGASAAAAWILRAGIALPPCGFKEFFGIPCPFCGSTRALAAFGRLDLAEALGFNPLASICFIGSLFVAGLQCVRARRGRVEKLPARARAALNAGGIWIGILLLLVNWIYLLFFLPR